MPVSRQEMISFIKQCHPEWTGLRVAGVVGHSVSFDDCPDRNIHGAYYSLIRTIRTGRKSKEQKQLLLPL